MKDALAIIAMDFGNSRVKLYNGIEQKSLQYKDGWEDQFSETLTQMLKVQRNAVIGYSTVNEAMSNKIEGVLLLKSFPSMRLGVVDVRKTSEIDINTPQGIGGDRVFGVVGASAYGYDSYITIDCGTAITLNIVKQKKLLGGAIMPGLKTQLASLHQATDKLPDVEVQAVHQAIGANTNHAILSGVMNGIVGGVVLLLNEMEREAELSQTKVFLTGGDGELLMKKLSQYRECEYNPYLVVQGIWQTTKRIYEQHE